MIEIDNVRSNTLETEFSQTPNLLSVIKNLMTLIGLNTSAKMGSERNKTDYKSDSTQSREELLC